MAADDLHRPGMRGRKRAAALALVFALAGCSAFEGPQPSDAEHTLCYTRLATTSDELDSLARQACGGSEPHFVKQEMDLSACPLLVPERAHFRCGG